LKLILIGVIVCCIVFPVLAYLGYEPFASYGQKIITFFSGVPIDKLTASMGALIGGTGISAGTAVALGYAYNKVKDTLKQTQSNLLSTQNQAATEKQQLSTQLTQAQTDAQIQLAKTQADAQAKIESAKADATKLQTQVSTMQQNYNSIDAQKTSLQTQANDLKTQLQKAQAQLEVLTPKVK